jgi:transcriptional regulator with XRE-family HTH domain
MDDQRVGTVIRLVRQRRQWRQTDLAERCGISQSVISRLERGHAGRMAIEDVRRIAAALDIRVDLVPRWRAGDLDRLINARHAALHEAVARWFREQYPAWTLVPEASFAFYADRGVIDILGWHPGRRVVLVIELKTEIADVNELLGTLDRKRRVARKVALERGWEAVGVAAWLIVAGSRINRRRVEMHAAMLRGALPQDGRAARHWLRDPVGSVAALSMWSEAAGGRPAHHAVRRVRST